MCAIWRKNPRPLLSGFTEERHQHYSKQSILDIPVPLERVRILFWSSGSILYYFSEQKRGEGSTIHICSVRLLLFASAPAGFSGK